MWDNILPILEVVGLALLLLVNVIGILMVAAQLPGTWLILCATGVVAWWQWEDQVIGTGVLIALGVLAIIGELIELFAGGAGSRKAGGTRLAAILALIGSIIGAILGTFIPIPVVGTVFGACAGASLGSLGGDRYRGRSWDDSKAAAKGAFMGKLWGTVAKMGVAVVMCVVVAVAIFV